MTYLIYRALQAVISSAVRDQLFGESLSNRSRVASMTTTSRTLPMAVIRRAIEEFQLPASDDQVLQIQQYITLLLAWNVKANLTETRDPLDILSRHCCER